MSNNKYSAITLPVPSTYHYQTSDPALQRFGSEHDLDVFGIAVDRCSIAKQMGNYSNDSLFLFQVYRVFFLHIKFVIIVFIRKSFCISMVQFIAMGALATLLVRIDPIYHWLQKR